MSSLTQRDKLAGVIDEISKHKPALVVLDIDLAPVADASHANDQDAVHQRRCACSAQTPVIVVRPIVIHVARKPQEDRLEGHASLFDAAFDPDRREACSPRPAEAADGTQRPPNLWFGSAIVWDDGDGVVRRVGTGQQVTIVDERAGTEYGTIAWIARAYWRRPARRYRYGRAGLLVPRLGAAPVRPPLERPPCSQECRTPRPAKDAHSGS